MRARAARLGAWLTLALAAAACSGRPFEAKAAGDFVEVEEEEGSAYDFRAVAPEGVAVAVRAIELSTAYDADFWDRAIQLRMRELDGYAFVSKKDVATADGVRGRELLFGHDEDGKAYIYRIRFFTRGTTLLVAEAGGQKELMERFEKSVDAMLGGLRFR